MTFDQRSQESILRVAFALHLDIVDDPISAWTGPGVFAPTATGDAALDGKTFDSVGASVLAVGPVTDDDNGVSPLTVALAGADINAEGARQFIRDRREYQGRAAYAWWCFLDENYANAEVERFYTGSMSVVRFQDGEEPVLSLTIDRDTRLVQTPPRRLSRQKDIWPGDTFADFLTDTANGNADQTPTIPVSAFDYAEFNRFLGRGF